MCSITRAPILIRRSRIGRIKHSYSEHSSFVKFVERNWYLGKLSDRSRDNLPTPATAPAGNNRSSHGGNEVAEASG
jgi:hypothetical protein